MLRIQFERKDKLTKTRITTHILYILLFRLAKYRLTVVKTNIEKVFDKKDITRICRLYYRHLATIIIEILQTKRLSRDSFTNSLSFAPHDFREEIAQKPFVALAGHCGNWEWANLYASLTLEHQIVSIYTPIKNQKLDQWFLDLRQRFGTKMYPAGTGALKTILETPFSKPLGLVLISDQAPKGQKSLEVDFLGQKTHFHTGGAQAAIDDGLGLYYWGCVPRYTGGYELQVKEIPTHKGLHHAVQTFARYLEEDIRLYPHNWLWSHKRWG